MPSYQKKRVGISNSFVVVMTWLDFIGDVGWTYQRFYGDDERDEGNGKMFGILSLMTLCASLVVTFIVMAKIMLKYRDKLRREETTLFPNLTIILLSLTNPQTIVFFPWKEEAYKNDVEKSLPNKDTAKATFVRLFEDIPEFVIQVFFIAQGPADTLTALNLVLTILALLYFMVGKCLVIFLGQDEENIGRRSFDGWGTSVRRRGDLPARSRSGVPGNFGDVVHELKIKLNELFGLETSVLVQGMERPRPLDDILADAQHYVCVENWERLPGIREKALALAGELGVPIPANCGGLSTGAGEGGGTAGDVATETIGSRV